MNTQALASGPNHSLSSRCTDLTRSPSAIFSQAPTVETETSVCASNQSQSQGTASSLRGLAVRACHSKYRWTLSINNVSCADSRLLKRGHECDG